MTAACYVLGCVLLGCNVLHQIVLTFVHLITQRCRCSPAGVRCQCWIDALWLGCRNVSRVVSRTEGTMRFEVFPKPRSRAHRTASGWASKIRTCYRYAWGKNISTRLGCRISRIHAVIGANSAKLRLNIDWHVRCTFRMCFYAENRLLWLHVLLEHSSVYSLPFDTHIGGDQVRMSHLLCSVHQERRITETSSNVAKERQILSWFWFSRINLHLNHWRVW